MSHHKPFISFCLIHIRLYGWAQHMWTNHYHLRQHHQPGSPLPDIHPQSAADLHHDAPLGLHRLLLLHQDRVDGHHQGLRLCSEHLRRKLPFRGPYCKFTDPPPPLTFTFHRIPVPVLSRSLELLVCYRSWLNGAILCMRLGKTNHVTDVLIGSDMKSVLFE